MKRITVMLVGVIFIGAIFVGVASAQSTQPTSGGQYPSVSNLKAFSAEANFMSLPGYLRYLVHQQTGQWLTYAEASRIVSQQKGQ